MELSSSHDALESFKTGVKQYLSQKGVKDFSKFKAHISYDKFVIFEWNYPTDIPKPKPEDITQIPIPKKPNFNRNNIKNYDYRIVIGPAGKDNQGKEITYKTTTYEIKFDDLQSSATGRPNIELDLNKISIQVSMFQNMSKVFHPLHDDITCNIGNLSLSPDKYTLIIEIDSFRATDGKGWSHDFLAFLRVSIHEEDIQVVYPVRVH